jgi:hypothetical protein
MADFAWAPLASGRPQSHFASLRFTELVPASRSTGGGAGESPVVIVPGGFDRAVLSWNGDGRWTLEMRLEIAGSLTPYFLLGVLDGARQTSAPRSATRGGATIPSDPTALLATPAPPVPVSVEVDTLVVRPGATATGFQVRATGEGNLRSLGVTHYRRDDRRYTDRPAVPKAWGTILRVPERAQRDIEQERPEERGIGGQVCSPTSLAMVLEYHGSRYRTIEVARAVWDGASRQYGNWPCNTGAAARLLDRRGRGWAAVVKMTGWDEVEREIAAGRPVILSHRWGPGDLTNAPISRSPGHLIVAVGFTPDGDVVVNDPAARAGEVRRVYKRRELFRTWQERGEGIAYLVRPA